MKNKQKALHRGVAREIHPIMPATKAGAASHRQVLAAAEVHHLDLIQTKAILTDKAHQTAEVKISTVTISSQMRVAMVSIAISPAPINGGQVAMKVMTDGAVRR